MSEYDSDIEFDFFDEPETGESPPSPGRPRVQRQQGGPPPPQRPGRAGIPPTARLAGLIAFGILIVVLLVLWVQSCSGASKKSSYKNYLDNVAQFAVDSNRLGNSLAQAIATPGIKAGELANKMNSLAQQQRTDQQMAAKIKPPAALTVQHRNLVESLQLRVDGLTGLASALRAGAGSTKVSETATNLASESQYLVASDVLWNAKFRVPTVQLMAQDGITGLRVPASRFLTDQGVDSSAFWSPVVTRLNGNGTSGGNTSGQAIGSGIVDVVANPGNHHLSTTSQTLITATTKLSFDVSVQNTGAVQLPSLQVTITIEQKGQKSITVTRSTPLINPSQTVVVHFANFQEPTFAVQSTLKVDVQTVPNETNPNNNSYSYPVLFSL
jgi:CARDB